MSFVPSSQGTCGQDVARVTLAGSVDIWNHQSFLRGRRARLRGGLRSGHLKLGPGVAKPAIGHLTAIASAASTLLRAASGRLPRTSREHAVCVG